MINKKQLQYLPTFGELLDRLSIIQLKEVFITDHKNEYAKEIASIVNDLQVHLDTGNIIVSGEMLRALVVLSQMNLHIWHNEAKYRAGTGDGNLGLTHGLNGIRNTAKNIIQDGVKTENDRKDYKIDCIAAEFKDWEVSWNGTNKEKIVWVNGTFDVLHHGHLSMLEFAKTKGDRLVVGIDTDQRVKQRKGISRPINSAEIRRNNLLALKWVDDVVIFPNDESLEQLISGADVMVIGMEYQNKRIVGGDLIDDIIFYPMVEGYSTTNILNYEKYNK